MKAMAVKVAPGDEVPVTGTQAAVVPVVAATAMERQANAKGEISPGRQGRPTAVGIAVSPGDPGRAPNSVRRPAPAPARMPEPAAVMERRPTPGIIRNPVPAVIGVNPAAGIEVRLPST